MYRGTTPTINYTTPFNQSEISDVYITFVQGDDVAFEKSKDSISISDKLVSVTLTQDETLSLDSKQKVLMQIRIKTTDEKVYASNVMSTVVGQVLKDDAI